MQRRHFVEPSQEALRKDYTNLHIHSGLRRVLDRIPETNTLDLDEAKMYVNNPQPTDVVFPYRLEEEPVEKAKKAKKRPAKQGKGIKIPVHKTENEKYNKRNMPKSIKKIIRKQFRKLNVCKKCKEKVFLNLIGNSIAKSTWKRYESANKLWEKCKKDLEIDNRNFSDNDKIAFLCWCKENTTLKSTTISMYMSAIGRIYKLTNKKSALKNLLNGCKNSESKSKKKKQKFKSLNFSQLKILKKKDKRKQPIQNKQENNLGSLYFSLLGVF